MGRIGWLLIGACAGGDGPEPGDSGRERVELVDDGRACLYGGAPGPEPDTAFTDGGAVTAEVVLEDCASGCAADVSASCELRLVQTEVVVTAAGSYTLPAGPRSCDDVCVPVVARCTGVALTSGSWSLDYAGGHSESFPVPGASPVPCAEPLGGRRAP